MITLTLEDVLIHPLSPLRYWFTAGELNPYFVGILFFKGHTLMGGRGFRLFYNRAFFGVILGTYKGYSSKHSYLGRLQGKMRPGRQGYCFGFIFFSEPLYKSP